MGFKSQFLLKHSDLGDGAITPLLLRYFILIQYGIYNFLGYLYLPNFHYYFILNSVLFKH